MEFTNPKNSIIAHNVSLYLHYKIFQIRDEREKSVK